MNIGDMVTLSEDQDGFGLSGDPVKIIAVLDGLNWDFTIRNSDGEEIDVMDDELLDEVPIFQP